MAIDWDEIREPLRREFAIPTNQGSRKFVMIEPTEEDLKPVFAEFPYPPPPTKVIEQEYRKPDGQEAFRDLEVPETDPDILKEYREDYKRQDELRWLGFVVVSLPPDDRPKGDDIRSKVEFLQGFPPVVKQRLIKEAVKLSNTRLDERFDKEKKG